MEIDRRSLLKGLLASGALLALRGPSWTFAEPASRRAGLCLLLSGDRDADRAFAAGVRGACVELGTSEPHIVELSGGLLANADQVIESLDRLRGRRWVAAMDDGSAAVFQELARTAGGRLLSVGSHVSVGDETSPVRHTWLTASAAQGIGGLLATQLAGAQMSFAITERFLGPPQSMNEVTSWRAPGFFSYRSVEPSVMHLHCSGLSSSAACRLLGVAGAEDWAPIPPHRCTRDTAGGQGDQWVEALGRAVAASALGVARVEESCVSRAFVHRTGQAPRMQPDTRVVSFIVDL